MNTDIPIGQQGPAQPIAKQGNATAQPSSTSRGQGAQPKQARLRPLALLDLVLRNGYWTNQSGISFVSDQPEMLYALHTLSDSSGLSIQLVGEEMPVEKFIQHYRFVYPEDLHRLTPKKLWMQYRIGKAHLEMSFDEHQSYQVQYGEGQIHNLKTAKSWLLRQKAEQKNGRVHDPPG